MYYILFYEVVEDHVTRRAPYREEHLRLLNEAHNRGELVMAGAFSEPVDGAALVFRVEPLQANNYQKHATFGDALFYRLAKVASRLDGGDIHEYRVFANLLDQIVKQTTSLSLRVTPPIADKDAAQFAIP